MFKKILVVDDETEIVKIITAYLKKENYHYDLAFDGQQALEKFRVFSPDLIILDLMIPKISGEEVCKEIRKTSDIPIIMLTAKTNESSIINGFKIGTDDYLKKPFSPKELILRIKSILRRYENGKENTNVLSFNDGDLIIDLNEQLVFKDNILLEFTASEFKILTMFASNPRIVFNREQIIEKALEEDFFGYSRTIDTHIKNIRKKIETDTKNPIYILTIYGFGYKFGGIS